MSQESRTGEARLLQTRHRAIVIAISVGTLLVEVAGGLLSGSLALLSDAGHVLTDLLALVLCLMAVRFASLPATPAKTYGYHRLEILTALVNGALLIIISTALFYQAVRRYLHPVPVHSGIMIGVALTVLAALVRALTGRERAGPIAARAIASVVVVGAVRLVIEGTDVLLEATPAAS